MLGQIVENNYSTFTTLKVLVKNKKNKASRTHIPVNIKSHLHTVIMLIDVFNRYFPEHSKTGAKIDPKRICNPFNINAGKAAKKSKKSPLI